MYFMKFCMYFHEILKYFHEILNYFHEILNVFSLKSIDRVEVYLKSGSTLRHTYLKRGRLCGTS